MCVLPPKETVPAIIGQIRIYCIAESSLLAAICVIESAAS